MSRFLMIGLAGCLAVLAGDAPAQVVPPQPHQAPTPDRVMARSLVAVVDDFIVDVYHNGVKVPDDRREILAEVFGATVERITVDVRSGDWLVFNVVNNRLRWGGASYFAVSGRSRSGMTFTTELESGNWSCNDDLSQVSQFIAERNRFADHRARPISKPWVDGDSLMSQHADGWAGKPLWGGSPNTWIKYIAP